MIKDKKFLFFGEKGDKAMEYEELLKKDYIINYGRLKTYAKTNPEIMKCLDKILNDNGRVDINSLENGIQVYKTFVSFDYKLAWNTLKAFKILVEVKKDE